MKRFHSSDILSTEVMDAALLAGAKALDGDSDSLCSGLMKPDTHLGENARHIEVSDDQTTPCLFR